MARKKKSEEKNKRQPVLKVIPLGGLQEIGKNITVFEYEDEIIVVDCGLAFPEDDMLGVDLVIPDMAYLIKNREKVRGIILTHAHEDHVGALPYVIRDLDVPVFGTKLTLGLIGSKLAEHGLKDKVHLQTVVQGQSIELGPFEIEFIRSTHSVADTVALAIKSPVGVVILTSDFKVDYTPVESEAIDLTRFAQLGSEGVILLMCDSTNVELPGFTMSERTVGESMEQIFMQSGGRRILVATFASNVHRIQQIVNAAVKFDRKVVFCGRSMLNVVDVATDLGYLKIPAGAVVDMDDINRHPSESLVLIVTGSQGEPMSVLTRIASSDHRKIGIMDGDLVILSANPIPGNEKYVFKVIDDLFKRGADVIYESLADVHVSGHACREELKIIHSLVKPKFFMPVHGEYRHLKRHAILAQSLGMAEENIFISENGRILELDGDSAKLNGSVEAGRVLVDGLGVGDVGSIVLRDRRLLSQDGLIVVVLTIDKDSGEILSGPDVISRGFVYVREAEDFMDEAREAIKKALDDVDQDNGEPTGKRGWGFTKALIKDSLNGYIFDKLKRRPMILPIIIEV
ncbi:MAG: ribonuclease J [Oscillospiraceae bacterium]|nr:ribonuclease J [Oscillospiraceae bacterium]